MFANGVGQEIGEFTSLASQFFLRIIVWKKELDLLIESKCEVDLLLGYSILWVRFTFIVIF